ncbi:dTDP-4-amino-4,6-dideoxygalactose transaminase [Thermoflexibacter ruber]|uniref:dTDP-4-amino-4,6-dideoxygalactose transaminase n=1 Tax=Thermoflexibacter ruber TaxID=1003 RepID=A0A1I2A6N4_9BACT|nr:dTDP-4-amino-4,6-dideoxygalactose transaminase [Thermoflexibacter ruber]SFE39581.1 dTDP-4-amino-4,6-dideoxygalactose transaminase [Thermoflexibacter ruber]
MHIPFNKPYLSGKEIEYIIESVNSLKISGDGLFTKKCHQFFEQKYGFSKCLLTTSCTDALEMAALLIDIQPNDEVIMPSFTFVSTANAFVLRGAKIIFADSLASHPNIDADALEALITPKTKAIVVVHYAGVACEMNKINELAQKYNLYVIEDAAQAIDSFYQNKPLGSIGHFGAFSFHETKNLIAGEGGMLTINAPQFIKRAEIIREKGTNRSAFFRGEVDKYNWVDLGSSFLPSDIIAAFLYAQLENLEDIQNKRKHIWQTYFSHFQELKENCQVDLPYIPDYATNNAHIFYLVCKDIEQRNQLIQFCKQQDVNLVFHYISLHKSPFYVSKHGLRELPNADRFSDCLVRLPLFYEMKDSQLEKVVQCVIDFFKKK